MSKKDNEEYNEEIEKIKNDILNILTNSSNELTLFELENSKILLALCCFYDKNEPWNAVYTIVSCGIGW